ncbi:MAG TPA: hypothetical protein EYP18_08880 [Desulfobacterales bacterium]|nr:hypothetical protein [Desulfobacterales bacterium]
MEHRPPENRKGEKAMRCIASVIIRPDTGGVARCAIRLTREPDLLDDRTGGTVGRAGAGETG